MPSALFVQAHYSVDVQVDACGDAFTVRKGLRSAKDGFNQREKSCELHWR
jgi:hypothetical protein